MYDEELEKAMLFYIIFEQEEYLLDENDFVGDKNKKIIRAINELRAEKKEISILSIKLKIKANQSQVLQYLTSLGEYIQVSSSEAVYNSIIELSKKRKLFKIMQEKTMEIAECENVDILAQDLIKQINQVEQINEKEKTFSQQIGDTSMWIEQNSLKKTDYSLYTGMLDLDKIICGLHNEELTIIGARPRKRKDHFCITDSRTYRRKRNRSRNYQFRDVRNADYTKNAI